MTLFSERGNRGSNLISLVRYDSPLDLVAVGLEELDEDVTALVLARAGDDAVRDCQHRRPHTSALVFSTSVMSVTTIPLSIAFAMS